jgi:hypothetical protein
VATLAINCFPDQPCTNVYYYENMVQPRFGPGSYYGSYAPETDNPYGAYHGGACDLARSPPPASAHLCLAADLPFIFGNARLTPTERNMSRTIQRYLGAFYRTGDPNSPALPCASRPLPQRVNPDV